MYGKCLRDEPRSIIVIDSPGCSWGKCKFCAVKHQVADSAVAIQQIKTAFTSIPKDETKLQVVSSASFSDYSDAVINTLLEQLSCTNIKVLILEQRWGLRDRIAGINDVFGTVGISIEWILGLESTSINEREYLGKEQYEASISEISQYFQRVNLLYGYQWKTLSLLKSEVSELYPHFNAISINIYENVTGSDIRRDSEKVEEFYNSREFTLWLDDPKIHIFDIDERAETDFGGIDTFERDIK